MEERRGENVMKMSVNVGGRMRGREGGREGEREGDVPV